jgi:outer membrane protein assembly factor BamB
MARSVRETLSSRATLSLLSVLTIAAGGPAALAGDWLSWRGPAQDGTSAETDLPASWSQDGQNLVWETHEVTGRNTPLVHGDRLYVFSGTGEGVMQREQLACLDANSGKLIWQRYENVYLTDIPAARLGWPSPVIDPETGAIFVHFTGGLFVAFDRDGNRIWQRSLTEEYNRVSGYGGRLMTPIVDGDLVIISSLNSTWGDQARGSHRFVAFDKRSGEVVWWSTPGGTPLDTIYSVPVVADVNGTRMLIAGLADGTVAGMKVSTGEPVWSFKLSKRGLNVTPVVTNNRVYIAHSEENIDNTVMGRVVCIDATGKGNVTATHEVWRADGLGVGYASPALHDGKLYVIANGGTMYCLDADSGKQLWEHKIGRVAKGSPVVADGKIYVTEVNARFVILGLNDGGCETLDEEEFKDPRYPNIDMFGSPAISNGRVYFTTMHGVYCIGAKQPRVTPTAAPLGPPAKAPADAKAAALAIYPADVALDPGAKKSFVVRAFDDAGRFIREVPDAEWTIANPKATFVAAGPDPTVAAGPRTGRPNVAAGPRTGGSDAAGELTIAADAPGSVGLLTANADGLQASARVRVVQPIPFEENFTSIEPGKFPPHWIGAGGKYAVEEREGEKVLKKPFNQRFMRVEVYMGRPEWHGYTLQADVAGTKQRRAMPDMGIFAHRYRFELKGNDQAARIVSWVPMPRIEKEIPFEWQPDKWYTMKMRVDMKGETAVVRGKVWPRDESEPGDWTLVMEDPIGQTEGAPGIYGFSMADVYFDNVRVWSGG